MSEIPAGEEPVIAPAKEMTAREVVKAVQKMGPINDLVADVWQLYFDTTAAHDAYTDEELALLGMTAAQLTSCVSFLEAIKNLMDGSAVAQSVYRITLNNVRHLRI